MYIDRPSHEGQRPLLNAFQFVQPSPEASRVAAPNAAPISPLGAANFSAATPPGPSVPGNKEKPPKGRDTATAGVKSVGCAGTVGDEFKVKNPGEASRNGQDKIKEEIQKEKYKEVRGKAQPATNRDPKRRQKRVEVDNPLPSDEPYPPFPKQRDARLKKPIAQQSGPATDEGKAAVSRNAVKHGGYALPTSGDESFASIEQSVIGRLEPTGSEQKSLARSISYEIWRIGNIERTVVGLDRDIDHEKVSLGQLALHIDFPFAESYREVMTTYLSEESLRKRVHGHLCGEFTDLLDRAARDPKVAASHMAGPNARAAALVKKGREVLGRPHLVQNLEEVFFEEFDAVMLDARLGRSSLHPSTNEPRQAGWALPIVECWVYRNFRQIKLTQNRLKSSLRMELMTSPSLERALRGATGRLGLLLSDYRNCRPDISDRRLQMIGYGPSRGAA
jgi:hypothetical protein